MTLCRISYTLRVALTLYRQATGGWLGDFRCWGRDHPTLHPAYRPRADDGPTYAYQATYLFFLNGAEQQIVTVILKFPLQRTRFGCLLDLFTGVRGLQAAGV